MSGVEIGVSSIMLIVVLIYLGLYVPVALGLVSFLGVWIIRQNVDHAVSLLSEAIADTVTDFVFATIPLFALMGLLVSKAGFGREVYEVANTVFYKVRGGLGIATVAANAVFASITGSSIASASVFTRVSVPEMRRFNYTARFSVGVVAGSSVLGMLIPPSAMLIIYAIVTEQSVGHMFLRDRDRAIGRPYVHRRNSSRDHSRHRLCDSDPDAVLRVPGFVGGRDPRSVESEEWQGLTYRQMFWYLLPVVILVVVVLGGIYGGIVDPVEAGAAGSLAALILGVIKGRLSWSDLWEVLVDTGHITATILFLIISASMYSRMLGVAALPTQFGEWMQGLDLSFTQVMALYVVLLVLLGTILDTASIILIVVPLFLPAIEGMGQDLVWFGIVTVVGAEIGLLTPPLGLSCYAIKSTIDDPDISLYDIFYGAFPFAVMMLLVLVLIIAFPAISLILV